MHGLLDSSLLDRLEKYDLSDQKKYKPHYFTKMRGVVCMYSTCALRMGFTGGGFYLQINCLRGVLGKLFCSHVRRLEFMHAENQAR